MKKFIFLILALSLIAACSSNDDEFDGSTEEFLYDIGVEQLELSAFERAILIFQQLEAQFPFGPYAAQSQIELVYAYFKNGEPEAARAAADRFIRLHPDDANVDYAYYMKGMAYYTENSRMFGRFLPTDPSKRDPGKAIESFADFSQLVARFPNSPYAADAQARMIYLKNLLASSEIHVAEFYIQRQAFVSALNRAKYVVESYQGTPSVPRALEIMVEMYLRLGLNDLADTSLVILRENYPNSPSLNENGEFLISTQITDPSFVYSVTFGLLGSNKRDTPLAPTKRPTATDTPYNFVLPDIEPDRSFLNIISLGVLGDSDTSSPDTTEQ